MTPLRTSSAGSRFAILLAAIGDRAFGHLAAFGMQQVRNGLQRRGLARAIAAQKRRDPALGHRQADAFQHEDDVIVDHLDIVDLKQRLGLFGVRPAWGSPRAEVRSKPPAAVGAGGQDGALSCSARRCCFRRRRPPESSMISGVITSSSGAMKSVIRFHFLAVASHCWIMAPARAAVIFAGRVEGLAEVRQAQFGHARLGDFQRFEPVAHFGRRSSADGAGHFLRLADRFGDHHRRIHAARIQHRAT